MTHQLQSLPLSIAVVGAVALVAASAFELHERQTHVSASPTASSSGRRPQNLDDTYGSLLTARKVEILQRAYGLRRYEFSGGEAGGIALDARRATFIVANSKNAHPIAGADCKSGSDPVNPYPIGISDAPGVLIIGGVILGRVPQTSDWLHTYCNSAALHLRRSPDAVIDGVRIAGAWDGVRAATGSPNLTLKNSWISDVRDDGLENDNLYSASVHDTLIDGAFQGISVKTSGADASNGIGETIVLSGLLLRLREYTYRGRNWLGAPSKNGTGSPTIRIRNSVVAVDSQGGATFPDYWTRGWAKMSESRNNVFLWLGTGPIPATFPVPPKNSGFAILSGSEAHRAWDRARRNWINCHPKIVRMPTDPRSEIVRCDRNYWGGFTD